MISEFLVKAKKEGYATGGEGKENRLSDGSKELTFKEKSLFYRDRYFGFNPFMGEEIVFENNKPLWGMNYRGEVLSKNKILAKRIYVFLKKALFLVPIENPYRGPSKFNEGGFRYENKWKGNVNRFSGVEKIYYKNKLVYGLVYHGGNL